MDLELRPPFPPPMAIDPLLQQRPAFVGGHAPPLRSASPRAPIARGRRRGVRSKAMLLGLATVIGLWFGLAAPSVSPVTPATPRPSTPAPQPSSTTPTGAGSQA